VSPGATGASLTQGGNQGNGLVVISYVSGEGCPTPTPVPEPLPGPVTPEAPRATGAVTAVIATPRFTG
jgi:hypothetical protein